MGYKIGQSFAGKQNSSPMSNTNVAHYFEDDIYIVDTQRAEDQCIILNKLLVHRFAGSGCLWFLIVTSDNVRGDSEESRRSGREGKIILSIRMH